MKVYIIVSITADGSPLNVSFSIEPVGVCSTLESALDYVNELDNYTHDGKDTETAYDVFEFEVAKEPVLLDWLKKEKKILEESVQQSIMELMKKGLVDQLIGEDGHFYYTLTDLGKETMKSIPEQIKKFFKK